MCCMNHCQQPGPEEEHQIDLEAVPSDEVRRPLKAEILNSQGKLPAPTGDWRGAGLVHTGSKGLPNRGITFIRSLQKKNIFANDDSLYTPVFNTYIAPQI